MLPAAQSTTGFFCGSIEVLYTAAVAIIFLSGGVSSELYVLFFPPLFATALHGSWMVVLAALVAVLFATPWLRCRVFWRR